MKTTRVQKSWCGPCFLRQEALPLRQVVQFLRLWLQNARKSSLPLSMLLDVLDV